MEGMPRIQEINLTSQYINLAEIDKLTCLWQLKVAVHQEQALFKHISQQSSAVDLL
jgi:hypothetical protein